MKRLLLFILRFINNPMTIPMIMYSLLMGLWFMFSTSLFLPVLIMAVVIISLISNVRSQAILMGLVPVCIASLYDPLSGVLFSLWLGYTFISNTYLSMQRGVRYTYTLLIMTAFAYGVFSQYHFNNDGNLLGFGYFLGRSIGITFLLSAKTEKEYRNIRKHTAYLIFSIFILAYIPPLWYHIETIVPITLVGFIFSMIRTHQNTISIKELKGLTIKS